LYEFRQRLALRPGVVAALHGGVSVADLLLVLDGAVEEVGVAFLETDPFVLALEEAEVAARACAPLVVVGQADASLVEDAHDAVLVDAVFTEGKDSIDIRLGADVAD